VVVGVLFKDGWVLVGLTLAFRNVKLEKLFSRILKIKLKMA